MRTICCLLIATVFLGGGPAWAEGPGKDDIVVGDIRVPRHAFRAADTKGKVTMLCALCHGENGAGDRAFGADVHFGTPVIVGLDPAYMNHRMDEFREATDGEMSILMKDPALDQTTTEALIDHFAGLPPFAVRDNPPPYTDGTARQEETKASALFQEHCTDCHGEKAMGNTEIGAPRLAGQNSLYIQARLTGWRDTAPDGNAPPSPMREVLANTPLTSKQMELLGDYLEQMVEYP